jgi:hypothetical protein
LHDRKVHFSEEMLHLLRSAIFQEPICLERRFCSQHALQIVSEFFIGEIIYAEIGVVFKHPFFVETSVVVGNPHSKIFHVSFQPIHQRREVERVFKQPVILHRQNNIAFLKCLIQGGV